jgi:hypothetical protein
MGALTGADMFASLKRMLPGIVKLKGKIAKRQAADDVPSGMMALGGTRARPAILPRDPERTVCSGTLSFCPSICRLPRSRVAIARMSCADNASFATGDCFAESDTLISKLDHRASTMHGAFICKSYDCAVEKGRHDVAECNLTSLECRIGRPLS